MIVINMEFAGIKEERGEGSGGKATVGAAKVSYKC